MDPFIHGKPEVFIGTDDLAEADGLAITDDGELVGMVQLDATDVEIETEYEPTWADDLLMKAYREGTITSRPNYPGRAA